MSAREDARREKVLGLMHREHGVTEGRVCGECDHLRGYTYFKCRKYPRSSHAATTDWRKGWPACGLFVLWRTRGVPSGEAKH